jgi:hypothetical protein
MVNPRIKPTERDIVITQGARARIASVGTGDYSINLDEGYEVDASELTLVTPPAGIGPAVWELVFPRP